MEKRIMTLILLLAPLMGWAQDEVVNSIPISQTPAAQPHEAHRRGPPRMDSKTTYDSLENEYGVKASAKGNLEISAQWAEKQNEDQLCQKHGKKPPKADRKSEKGDYYACYKKIPDDLARRKFESMGVKPASINMYDIKTGATAFGKRILEKTSGTHLCRKYSDVAPASLAAPDIFKCFELQR